MKKITQIIALCLITFTIGFSQEERPKLGLMVMGNPFDPPVDIGISIWANNKFVIEPAIGLLSVSPDEIPAATNLNLNLALKAYFNKKIVDPYIGIRFGYNSIFSGDKSYSDLLIGIIGGAEYFISNWFSAGWEFHLNYVKTDKEYSPTDLIPDSKIFYTSQFLILKLYFM